MNHWLAILSNFTTAGLVLWLLFRIRQLRKMSIESDAVLHERIDLAKKRISTNYDEMILQYKVQRSDQHLNAARLTRLEKLVEGKTDDRSAAS